MWSHQNLASWCIDNQKRFRKFKSVYKYRAVGLESIEMSSTATINHYTYEHVLDSETIEAGCKMSSLLIKLEYVYFFLKLSHSALFFELHSFEFASKELLFRSKRFKFSWINCWVSSSEFSEGSRISSKNLCWQTGGPPVFLFEF